MTDLSGIRWDRLRARVRLRLMVLKRRRAGKTNPMHILTGDVHAETFWDDITRTNRFESDTSK